jgi:hypothetical protein
MWLGLAFSGFALVVLLHAVFARMGGSLTIVLSFLCVGIPTAVLLAALAFWAFGISDDSIAVILVYFALCETYIFLFTLAANGVSVSLMMRMRSQPVAPDDLIRLYSTRAMVERRIDQLQAGGFLAESEGQLRLLERGKVMVRAFELARNVFRHRPLPDIRAAQYGERLQDSPP